MQFVINEWLLDYLRPDAIESNRIDAFRFINMFLNSPDIIIVRRPSPFLNKFFRYMKNFGYDMEFKARFKILNDLLFRNADKTIILDDQNIMNRVPEHLGAIAPSDDFYLIEAACNSADRTILTTDGRLKDIFQNEPSINIIMLDELLKDYSGIH